MFSNNGSFLDNISQASHMHIWSDWANGKLGSISDAPGVCVYRFYEVTRDESGKIVEPEDYTTEKFPIVATGIIGYWLHFRNNRFSIAAAFGPKEKQTFSEQFAAYTNDKLTQYKAYGEREDPSSWRRDLEREFYTEFIIPNEEKLNKATEALFEFISPAERKIVKRVIEEYTVYLKMKKNAYTMPKAVMASKEAELKVLKYWDTDDDSVLEGMPDYEFNVVCDDLEEKGLLKVAWVEGHSPEAAKLLDRGKLYLRQLEAELNKEGNPQTGERNGMEATTSQNEAPAASQSLHTPPPHSEQEKWDASLDEVFIEGINPQAVCKRLQTLTEKNVNVWGRAYIFYIIFSENGLITSKRGNQSAFLAWLDMHLHLLLGKTTKKRTDGTEYEIFQFGNNIHDDIKNNHHSEWPRLSISIAENYHNLYVNVQSAFFNNIGGKLKVKREFLKEG